nr:hypothetical protein [Tanacetum cinerariifolium]
MPKTSRMISGKRSKSRQMTRVLSTYGFCDVQSVGRQSESSGNQLFYAADLGNSLTIPCIFMDRCNAVVLNWILSSLSQEVYLGHVFSNNVVTVWNELKDTYDRINGSIVFNLLQKTNPFKQRGLPVSEYYHKLNSLWREYEILTKLPDCTCNARLEVANYDKMLKLMQFLKGLDDIYQPIRSSILTREVLPEAKDAFLIISREESHRGIPSSSGVYDNLLCKNCSLKGHTIDRYFELIGYPPGFKRNPNLKPNTNENSKSNSGDFRKGSSNNSETKTSGHVSFINEHAMKLMSLLNDKGSAGQSNMTGANPHMTNSIKDMVNLVDVFDLKLTVGHPNGTLAKITHVGNLKLNNDVMLFDVLVITKYTGLKKGRVLGTGSEFGGLYLFDKEYNKFIVANNSYLNLSNIDHEGPCEDETVSEVTNLNSFDCVKSDTKPKTSISPNDDEEGSSCRDCSIHQSGPSHSLDQPEVDEQIPTLCSGSDLQGSGNDGLVTATTIDENTSSEGNVGFNDQSDGEVDRFKARVVAKGFGQKEGTSKVEIAKFKHFLSNEFKINDLACRAVLTPLPENIILAHKETKKDKFLVNVTSYQRLVGKLIYLTLTRPDISYVVHCLSQYMHAPLKSHFDIALRLLKYLKLAPGFGVQFVKRRSVFDIKSFLDSDWAKCLVTRRSVFGYCVFVNGCLVSWKSKKQVTLSKSSAEAEYRSMAAATCEIMWIVKIMFDFNIKNLFPAELYCDNKAAM